MLDFLRKNWKMLLLSSIALFLAGVCIFAPPTAIAAGIIGLASSPVFAIFGSYAANAATASVALGVAAATFVAGALVNATVNLFLSALSTLFTSRSAQKPSMSTSTDPEVSGLDSSSKLSLLGGTGLKIDTSAPPKMDGPGECLSPDSLRFQPRSPKRRKDDQEIADFDSTLKLC